MVFRHALPLDSGLDFHQHTDRLISGICDVLPEGKKRRGQAMSADNLRLEIGHVLFIDIVGYSKLLVDEEAELVKELGDVVNNTEAARQAEARGQLIRLPSGDGMALVFTNSVEAPVKCALEMSAVLKNKPNLPLRMGVHSGPVQQVEDVNARTSLAGAGINLAQRVMDCGDAGHILLSKRVRGRPGSVPLLATVPARPGRVRGQARRAASFGQSLRRVTGQRRAPAEVSADDA